MKKNINTLEKDREVPEFAFMIILVSHSICEWKETSWRTFIYIIISNILQKCQYFSQQIFCYSLLPKVNLSYHALCFRMTTTTLIKTHEIITIFCQRNHFLLKWLSFLQQTHHGNETNPTIELIPAKSISDFLQALSAMPPGSSPARCQTRPWHWGEGAHLSAGRFCLKKPQKLGCTYKYSSFFKFFLSLSHLCYPCSLFYGSTLGVLHYQLLRYTLLACWDGTWPSLLSCTSSPAPGNLLDLIAVVSHQAQGLAVLSALPSLAAAFRQDRLNQPSTGLRGCKVLPVPTWGQNDERCSPSIRYSNHLKYGEIS